MNKIEVTFMKYVTKSTNKRTVFCTACIHFPRVVLDRCLRHRRGEPDRDSMCLVVIFSGTPRVLSWLHRKLRNSFMAIVLFY